MKEGQVVNREQDLSWYQSNRKQLAERYAGAWLVVLGQTVMETFSTEEEAINFAIRRYGINQASIFQAVAKDPFIFI